MCLWTKATACCSVGNLAQRVECSNEPAEGGNKAKCGWRRAQTKKRKHEDCSGFLIFRKISVRKRSSVQVRAETLRRDITTNSRLCGTVGLARLPHTTLFFYFVPTTHQKDITAFFFEAGETMPSCHHHLHSCSSNTLISKPFFL